MQKESMLTVLQKVVLSKCVKQQCLQTLFKILFLQHLYIFMSSCLG